MTSYGESVNWPLLDFMGELHGTVLDVGCGRGAWADELRGRGASALIGLEPSDDAVVASERYDSVINAAIADAQLPPADILIAADVLEHLYDPWSALRRIRSSVGVGAELFVSVPNIQFAKALLTIARGRFPRDTFGGFWDRTHVQWFTASSLAESLTMTGWSVDSVLSDVGSGRRALINSLTLSWFRPLLAHQLFARARAVDYAATAVSTHAPPTTLTAPAPTNDQLMDGCSRVTSRIEVVKSIGQRRWHRSHRSRLATASRRSGGGESDSKGPLRNDRVRGLLTLHRVVRPFVPRLIRRWALERLPSRIRDAILPRSEDDALHPERLAVLDHITGSVIEIGCGYRKSLTNSIGIDLVPAGELGTVGNVAGRMSQADVAADGGRLPLRSWSCDTLIARHNLEHYVDTLAVLREWKRVVRRGGRLVIVVPDEEAYEGRTLDLDPTHFHGFSQDSLRSLVEAAGMEVVLIRPVIPAWSFLLVAEP